MDSILTVLGKITSFLSCKETANLAMTSSRLNRLSTRMVWVVDRFFCQKKPPEHLNVHFVFPKLSFRYPRMLYSPNPPGNFGNVVDLRCCYDFANSQTMTFCEFMNGFYVMLSVDGRNHFANQRLFFSKPPEETDPTKFVHEVIFRLYQVRQ
jgi:hypothetical protein